MPESWSRNTRMQRSRTGRTAVSAEPIEHRQSCQFALGLPNHEKHPKSKIRCTNATVSQIGSDLPEPTVAPVLWLRRLWVWKAQKNLALRKYPTCCIHAAFRPQSLTSDVESAYEEDQSPSVSLRLRSRESGTQGNRGVLENVESAWSKTRPSR